MKERKPQPKALLWDLVYPHLETGRLDYSVGAPTAILVSGDVCYELSWRDVDNCTAYYDRWWVSMYETNLEKNELRVLEAKYKKLVDAAWQVLRSCSYQHQLENLGKLRDVLEEIGEPYRRGGGDG